MTTVGIIANSASGRDIRRLVSGASVFDNAEKGSMVARLLAGLGAAGVDRTLLMPTHGSVVASLERHLRARQVDATQPIPDLEWLDLDPTFEASDTTTALELMAAADVDALCVLGGDGTQRLVAGGPDIPVLALSTGTNNAFPHMGEATVAGLATGLVASGAVPREVGCRRERALLVVCGERREHALVDVGVSTSLFSGSRAIWRLDDVLELFVTFAEPTAIGLSAIAAAVADCPRDGEVGVHVVLTATERATSVVQVPLAPGVVVPVGIAQTEPLKRGEAMAIAPGRGSLSIDGEREIERAHGEEARVSIVDGPRTIDVAAVMRAAGPNRG